MMSEMLKGRKANYLLYCNIVACGLDEGNSIKIIELEQSQFVFQPKWFRQKFKIIPKIMLQNLCKPALGYIYSIGF